MRWTPLACVYYEEPIQIANEDCRYPIRHLSCRVEFSVVHDDVEEQISPPLGTLYGGASHSPPLEEGWRQTLSTEESGGFSVLHRRFVPHHLQHIEKRLNIKAGQSTIDGKIFLKEEEECLAACTGAPMMMVDHHYIENLDIKTVDQILNDLEKNND